MTTREEPRQSVARSVVLIVAGAAQLVVACVAAIVGPWLLGSMLALSAGFWVAGGGSRWLPELPEADRRVLRPFALFGAAIALLLPLSVRLAPVGREFRSFPGLFQARLPQEIYVLAVAGILVAAFVSGAAARLLTLEGADAQTGKPKRPGTRRH